MAIAHFAPGADRSRHNWVAQNPGGFLFDKSQDTVHRAVDAPGMTHTATACAPTLAEIYEWALRASERRNIRECTNCMLGV
jgi:hypothetical protein